MTVPPAGQSCATCSNWYDGACHYWPPDPNKGWTLCHGTMWCAAWGRTPASEGPTGPAGAPGADGATGPQGPAGADGTSVKIVGSVATSASLDPAYAGAIGDGYLAQDTGHLWVWDGAIWNDVGAIRGPAGADGTTPHLEAKILTSDAFGNVTWTFASPFTNPVVNPTIKATSGVYQVQITAISTTAVTFHAVKLSDTIVLLGQIYQAASVVIHAIALEAT